MKASKDKIEKIKKQIEVLLKMAKGDNKFEAQDAMRKARQLMMQYHLGEDEVTEGKISTVKQMSIRYTNLKLQYHHLLLASLIAKNFRCKHFYRTQEVVFLGMEEDASAARELQLYLTKTIESAFKVFLKSDKIVNPRKYEDQGPSFSKAVKKSWIEGFIAGLMEVLEEQTKTDPGYDLMVTVPQEVSAVYEGMRFKKGSAKGHWDEASRDYNAFSYGKDSAREAMGARTLDTTKNALEG